jgi:phage terminase large subunit-like protein
MNAMLDFPQIAQTPALSRPQERRPYQPFGACRSAWRSARREVLLAGPADTGKSRLWLEKVHYCACKYPGMRGGMVRKTRKSLTQSAIVTYEQKVLPVGLLSERAKRGHIHFSTQDQQYEYPNGSIIAVSGLDDPEKLKSSEWDFLYFMEATEGSLNDWEMLLRGLRYGVMPYPQLGGDCNPSYPTHWLKARCDAGMTLMLYARHEDNPSITPERLALLRALTGVRYLRLYKGLWVAAEGIVYGEWNPRIHKVSREQLKQWQVFYTDGTLNRQVIRRVLGGVDWGFSNAGVLGVYGIDPDGRMYLLKEVYRTQRTIDWWIPQAQALAQEFGVERWLADPSRPDYIQQFNQAGLPCEGAMNAISLGIGWLRARLRVAADGRPRFFLYEYANTDPDEELAAQFKPTGIEQEFEQYVWPKPKEGHPLLEVPVDENNHALDEARYVVAELDAGGDLDALDAETVEALATYRGY